MKHSILLFASIVISAIAIAQSSLNTSGGESSGPGHASYSVGQVSYTALASVGDDASTLQGVQVPFEFFINTCEANIELTPALFGVAGWDTIPVPGTSYSTPGSLGDASDDTWYYFTAESANDYILAQSANGSFDAVIEFFDACAGNSLGAYNNYGDGAVERVIPGGLTPGTEYHFRVYDPEPGLPGASDVRVQVKTFAKEGIRDQYCGVMDFQLSDVITPKRQDLNQLYPNSSIATKGYSVRLTDQSDMTSSVRNQYGIPSWYFTLNTFSNADVNSTYDATARHMLRLQANGAVGSYWSEWGPECTIGIGSVPLSQIRPNYCNNAIDYGFDQLLQAEFIPYADKYRFIFTDGSETLIEENTSYGVFLYEVEGLQLNTMYSVTVQARVNGEWSIEGPSCDIFMLSQPQGTSVRTAYCNGTYDYPQSPNYILAETVQGAEAYEWRATPVGGGSPQTDITPGISLAMHLTSIDFSAGGDWDIEVRAFAGGVWGDYEASCPITINATNTLPPHGDDTAEIKILENPASQLTLYPNPNDGLHFTIHIDGLEENEKAIVYLRDLRGRLIESQNYIHNQKAGFTWKGNSTLESGVYLIETQIDQENMSILFTVD